MSREHDHASDIEQMQRDAALADIRKNQEKKLFPKCACYNCDETLGAYQLFCDPYCWDDYEKRVKHA